MAESQVIANRPLSLLPTLTIPGLVIFLAQVHDICGSYVELTLQGSNRVLAGVSDH
jgi:hypothetical protein